MCTFRNARKQLDIFTILNKYSSNVLKVKYFQTKQT